MHLIIEIKINTWDFVIFNSTSLNFIWIIRIINETMQVYWLKFFIIVEKKKLRKTFRFAALFICTRWNKRREQWIRPRISFTQSFDTLSCMTIYFNTFFRVFFFFTVSNRILLKFFTSFTAFFITLELLFSLFWLCCVTFDLTSLFFLFFYVAVNFCFMISALFFEDRFFSFSSRH